MKFIFKNFIFKTDGGKLVPSLMHEYHPTSYPDVTFKCEYLTNGEVSRFMKTNSNGDFVFDMKAIFHAKVILIEGLSVVDEEGKEIEVRDVVTFEKLPSCTELTTMLNEVAVHLMSAATLTEEEVKNSDTGTNA